MKKTFSNCVGKWKVFWHYLISTIRKHLKIIPILLFLLFYQIWINLKLWIVTSKEYLKFESSQDLGRRGIQTKCKIFCTIVIDILCYVSISILTISFISSFKHLRNEVKKCIKFYISFEPMFNVLILCIICLPWYLYLR